MFIFAADLHLSLCTWQKLPELNRESLFSFQFLLKEAAKRNCSLVLGGDIFDSIRVSPELLTEILKIRDNYRNVKIFYINGNHDAIEPSWTSFMGNTVRLGTNPEVLSGGEDVCGIDFKTNAAFPEAVKSVYRGCSYLVIHQTLDKLSNGVPFAIDSRILEDFKCVLAGDYHIPGEVQNEYGHWMISPGSTNRRTITEPQGTYIVFNDDGTRESLKFPIRNMITIQDYTEPNKEDVDKFLNQLTYSTDRTWGGNPELEKGIIVLRGSYTKEEQTQYKLLIDNRSYILFVPKAEAAEEIEMDLKSKTAVKGSMAYVLEMLEEYYGDAKAKELIADYLKSPANFMDMARGKLIQ